MTVEYLSHSRHFSIPLQVHIQPPHNIMFVANHRIVASGELTHTQSPSLIMPPFSFPWFPIFKDSTPGQCTKQKKHWKRTPKNTSMECLLWQRWDHIFVPTVTANDIKPNDQTLTTWLNKTTTPLIARTLSAHIPTYCVEIFETKNLFRSEYQYVCLYGMGDSGKFISFPNITLTKMKMSLPSGLCIKNCELIPIQSC